MTKAKHLFGYLRMVMLAVGTAVLPSCSTNTQEIKEAMIEMVTVDGGTFQMGATLEQGSDARSDERPVHSVTVSTFRIGKCEVTQSLWVAVMGSNPSDIKGDDLPVNNVSWNDVQKFIKKLNQQTGRNYRLPTEAEWEFAARGGNKSRGYKYSGSNNIDDVAWYIKNSNYQIHFVGTKYPNELGIYDMTGNVEEWCNDWYGDYEKGSQIDPKGLATGSHRVIRGGSNDRQAEYCHVSCRYCNFPDRDNCRTGFRLAL